MSRRSSTGSSKRGVAERAARRSRAKSNKILYLDCFSGIAGNMFLAALLDLGLSRRELAADLAGLGVDHALRVRRVRRGPLAARYLDVRVPVGGRSGSRSYAEIQRLLRRARLDAEIRETALAIFEALGRAEARVHGRPLAKVHFHEVGAVDALVDVTGAAIGLARLGIERVTASPVALGDGGSVETEHGRLPLPAPATLELLRGIPTVPAHVRWETVTPTGAAILRTVVDTFGALPAMTVESVGHGAGDDREGFMPNVLRAVLGRAGTAHSDRIVTLETNLDDLVPEHFDYLMERLFEAGALDVSLQHLQMKKNRPGFLVRVLARPADRLALARVLFAESTAIGVRATESDRMLLERDRRRVATAFGRVGVKRVWDGDGRAHVTAEYDDCKRAAKRAGVPLRDVVRAAENAGRALGD
jgi:uncharacterized protein (TIGR00299 family) protein